MCVRTTCSTCGKPTYSGCGRHVDQVLGDVPKAERCTCRLEQPKAEPSFFERLLGGKPR